MKLAYITSMATGGLAGFNYKELVELGSLGVDVSLFITKYKTGPYMPPASTATHKVERARMIALQPVLALQNPLKYCRLLLEALGTRTIQDFAVAQIWSRAMVGSSRNWIHCHWGDHKLFIGYYCHRLTGLPLSVTLHGYDLYANPNWALFERALNACKRIITISEYNKNLLTKRFGAIGERVNVIRLFSEAVAEPKKLRAITKVLIVGGFHYRKGYDVLLDALKRLDRKDIQLWVVGYKGPVDVQGLVNERGLCDRVTIFGQVNDEVLSLLYTYCDIFCMPSRMGRDGVGEGLPVALMEAMSYEKPVVSTFHTGIPELVPDILVPENDAEALAQGIARLADDPPLRQKMGARNRLIVSEQYSKQNVRTLLAALSNGAN
jgi:colanic acid/amylovoran biosynthesis glycosyltransferase